MQKLELQEPPSTLCIPYIPRHSGAVINPVLREVGALKIVSSTLCNTSHHSGCQEGPVVARLTGRVKKRKQLISNSRLKKQKSKMKLRRKQSTQENNPDKPLSSIHFHAILFLCIGAATLASAAAFGKQSSWKVLKEKRTKNTPHRLINTLYMLLM